MLLRHFLFSSETWRVETEEVFVTPVGHKLFFSGGDGGSGHQGVGGCDSQTFASSN